LAGPTRANVADSIASFGAALALSMIYWGQPAMLSSKSCRMMLRLWTLVVGIFGEELSLLIKAANMRFFVVDAGAGCSRWTMKSLQIKLIRN
jgi:hypothetical protein